MYFLNKQYSTMQYVKRFENVFNMSFQIKVIVYYTQIIM